MTSATELSNWLNGTINGGPNGDGRYPMTGKDGNVRLVPCPALTASLPNSGTATPTIAEIFGNSDAIPEGSTKKFMSAAEKTKLEGIASGAEVNVNADWNATSGDAQILNKPDLVAANHNHDSAYLKKSGEIMYGQLTLSNLTPLRLTGSGESGPMYIHGLNGAGDDIANIHRNSNSNYKLNWNGEITTSTITTSGEIRTTSANSYRMVSGRWGTFWRHDGSDQYFMISHIDQPYGGWDKIPLRISLTSGEFNFSYPVRIGGHEAWHRGNVTPLDVNNGGTVNAVLGTTHLRTFYGAVGQQTGLRAYGWGNGIARWQDVIEWNGSWSLYGYDQNGAGAYNIVNFQTPGNGGIFKTTLNGEVAAKVFTNTDGESGEKYRVGNDASLHDVNVANTVGIKGLQNPNQGYLSMGDSGGRTFGWDGFTWTVNGELRDAVSTSWKLKPNGTGDPNVGWGYSALQLRGPFGGGVRFWDSGKQVGIWVQSEPSLRIGFANDEGALRERVYLSNDPGKVVSVDGQVESRGSFSGFQFVERTDSSKVWSWWSGDNSASLWRSGAGTTLRVDSGGNLFAGSGVYAPNGLFDSGHRTWSRNTRPELDGYAASISDWNTALNNGKYMAANAANAPDGSGEWFIADVTQHNGNWVTQRAWKFTHGPESIVWERRLLNGSWSAWTTEKVVGALTVQGNLSMSGREIRDVGTIFSNDWFRSNGNSGWYNQTHGGGIWMNDPNWVRVYGGKSFACDATISGSRLEATDSIYYLSTDRQAWKRQPRIFVDPNDPAGQAQDNDLWIW